MSSTLRITGRDREILHSLCIAVRLFSQNQIASYWFGGDRANARRRLKRLASEGLVLRIAVRARTLPQLNQPVASWQCGQPAPSFAQVSNALRQRWKRNAVRTCTCFVATNEATRLFGGRGVGELKKPAQAGHDLGVSQVWLRFAATRPDWAKAWRGEDVMAHTRRGEKLPDAFIVNSNNDVVCLIEFGGAYDQRRTQAFHEDCVARELPYQMW